MITQTDRETSLTTRLEMTLTDLLMSLMSEIWNTLPMETRAIALTCAVLAVLLFIRWLRNETKGTTLLVYTLQHFPDVCFVGCSEIIQTYFLKNDNVVHTVMGWMPCRQRVRQSCTTQEWTAWVDEYMPVFVLAILVLFYVVLGFCSIIHTHKPGKNTTSKNTTSKNTTSKNSTRLTVPFVFALLWFGFEMTVAKGVFANTDQEHIVWSRIVFGMLLVVIRRSQRQHRSNCVHRMMHIVKWCLRVVLYLFVGFIIAGSNTYDIVEQMHVYHSTRDPMIQRDIASGLKDSVVRLLPIVLLLVRLIQSPDAFGQIIVKKETVVRWKRLRYLQ